ncbi:MAG: hypothetical protein ACFFG0_29575 [Candidatus Thorarchaeota archaeon]
MRKINKAEAVIEEIQVSVDINIGILVFTSAISSWFSGGRDLTKSSHNWQQVGQIYPVADGTWVIAWDGDCI